MFFQCTVYMYVSQRLNFYKYLTSIIDEAVYTNYVDGTVVLSPRPCMFSLGEKRGLIHVANDACHYKYNGSKQSCCQFGKLVRKFCMEKGFSQCRSVHPALWCVASGSDAIWLLIYCTCT